MKKIATKISVVFLVFLAISSCSTKTLDVKSPCVSKEDGPCGPRKPINDWWLGKSV